MRVRKTLTLACASLVLPLAVAGTGARQTPPATITQLDRYAAGAFDEALGFVKTVPDLQAAYLELGTKASVYDTGTSKNTIERFAQVLDDCRRSYVLAYVPQGVKPVGWHAVTVTLPKLKRYSVRARKGYSGW